MTGMISPWWDATEAPGLSSQWRIYITAVQTAGNYATIKEIEMRATSGGADQCNGGNATASSYNTLGTPFLPSLAFDNDTSNNSVWQAHGSSLPQWISYIFPNSVDVTEVTIMSWSTAGDAPKSFDIQYFDGTDWQTMWSETNVTGWTSNQVRTFTKP